MVDEKATGTAARTRGIKLISSMNSVNMIIMNGIDSGGEHTYEKVMETKDGKTIVCTSVIDYIILSDNIVVPDQASSFLNIDFI